MKVSGEATLHAPADRVWQALNDPAVLVRTIPGCERLESTGTDAYSMTVTAGVAAVKGTYTGEVALSDKREPHSFVMTASGAGAPGTVRTDVRVVLDPVGEAETLLRYDADAVVGGMVAGVGQRMLTAVGKRMAGEFFAAVDDVLTGKEAVPAETSAAGTPAASPDQRVYAAPAAAATGQETFLRGVLVGAAVALAGVLVGTAVGRIGRRG
jgi:carbon monoxide dehydrogenase subunit G